MTSLAPHISLAGNSKREKTPARHKQWIEATRRHAYIVPSFMVCMLVCAWFVTWGDWQFFAREPQCGFYDAQARSLLHARVDVPPAAIGFEAFLRDRKTYGYFGTAPALLRVPLVLLFDAMDGRYSRCFMLAACFINLLCAYRVLLLIRGHGGDLSTIERVYFSLFILCAGIGSTNVFILNRAYVYHEAVIWGGAFALLFAQSLLTYLRTPSLWLLAFSGLFSFMSFHSRATAGAGTLLALCILTALLLLRCFGGNAGKSLLGLGKMVNPASHAAVGAASIVLILATYFAVNYAKFRTFDGVPVKYYGLYIADPQRMQVTGGRQIHPENIPTGLATYFGFRGMRTEAGFPWIHMNQHPSVIGHPALDVAGEFSSIPVSMPALTLLALAAYLPLLRGKARSVTRARLLVVTLLAGGCVVLATVGVTERYLHDFYPFLLVMAAIGVCRLTSGPRVRTKITLLSMLTLLSIALNCTFAIEDQRVPGWGVPAAKCNQWSQVRQSINRLLPGWPFRHAGEGIPSPATR